MEGGCRFCRRAIPVVSGKAKERRGESLERRRRRSRIRSGVRFVGPALAWPNLADQLFGADGVDAGSEREQRVNAVIVQSREFARQGNRIPDGIFGALELVTQGARPGVIDRGNIDG